MLSSSGLISFIENVPRTGLFRRRSLYIPVINRHNPGVGHQFIVLQIFRARTPLDGELIAKMVDRQKIAIWPFGGKADVFQSYFAYLRIVRVADDIPVA